MLGGGYRLTRLLAVGGMSHVYEADDALLSRRVAIKVVDDRELGTSMLVDEARALAAVRHPGLPAIHALGVHRGWTYLVLERLYGVDLETHLAGPRGGKRLDPSEALPILASLASVLSTVHAAGMAHRDLKPGNVMLCAESRVVLLDFGITVPLVAAGSVPRSGTPRYLAPEVIRSAVEPGRAHLVDVYAFGSVAFEMFAGRTPFVSEGVVEMLEHQLRTAPPDLAELRPDLPPALTALIGSCLAKDPAQRPGDMEVVAWELRSLWRKLVGGSGPVRLTPGSVQSAREIYRRAIDSDRTPSPREILIVEDDEDIRDSLAELLTARGFRVQVAADGQDALDAIRRRGRPSLILLDLMMPRLDGHGFLQSQSEDPSLGGIPVVLVTAQPADKARAFSAVRGVAPKPLDVGPLLQLINRVCAR
jgi:serine/threonine protein kinase